MFSAGTQPEKRLVPAQETLHSISKQNASYRGITRQPH
jgi:hypothetical protein